MCTNRHSGEGVYPTHPPSSAKDLVQGIHYPQKKPGIKGHLPPPPPMDRMTDAITSRNFVGGR